MDESDGLKWVYDEVASVAATQYRYEYSELYFFLRVVSKTYKNRKRVFGEQTFFRIHSFVKSRTRFFQPFAIEVPTK